MACPVASTTPSILSYGTFENRDSEFVQPEEGNLIEVPLDSSLIERSEDKKGLQPRAVVVLSNTVRNVAVIETIRFLAIVGLVCSAVASVLLPALGFAAIAAGACVLKNRVIRLDARTRLDLDTAVEEVADQTFSRSPSMRLQTREPSNDGSIGRSRGASIAMSSTGSIPKEVPQKVEVKETFLNSLGDRDNLNMQDLHGLLAICYFYLLGKTADMPKSLTKEGLLSPNINTQTYFEKKFKDCFAKTSAEFQNSAKLTLDNEGHKIPEVNEKQRSLGSANPSLIMEIAQELHRQISREQYRHKNKTEANHHTIKAEHAVGYIGQLRTFELQKGLHFTEDANYA